jgi:hypothetical protein
MIDKNYYNKPLDITFVRNFKDKLNWYAISLIKELNEDFIREFKDYVDWYYISLHQKLSENFIREFQDKVNWFFISSNQKLSQDFIREFKDKIDWFYFLKNIGYTIIVKLNTYQIKSDNYCSDPLSLLEFNSLALKLVLLKAFK